MQILTHNLVLAYQCAAAFCCGWEESLLVLNRLSLALSLVAFTAPAWAQTPLRVAAAADLEPLLPSILAQFQHETGIRAEATYQASAMLTTEIKNGAPFDVFLSANMEYPQKLISAGLAQGLGEGTSGTPILYAKGNLVLWTRKDTHLPNPDLELLRSPALKHLAIANPERAPYGKAAVAFLQDADLYRFLQSKLVIAENIAQAAQFVDSGNADAGLISMTSALTPRLAADGHYIVIPAKQYPPIEQGAVLVSNSAQRVAAKKFLVFLMSAPTQQLLRKFGLIPARPVP
jgi:molybdate transport system substrate-binding protein